jgi:ornithine cyclodeaminase/alanine dehydrogenase-like protein (mu-crystallin family)
LILTGNDVDQILHTLSVEVAVESQSKVFKAFSAQSRPKSSPNLTDVADSGVSKSTTTSSVSSVQTPQRINLQSHQVTTLFMPSRVQLDGGEKNGSMACKIVSVPTAGGDGLPASTVVVDETRGNVKALVNARKLTAIRNAAGE